jgi:predicted AlkP superfamily phosphohydrolase/phosphomutase
MEDKVILVGIDGASWTVLAPLLSRGELPNLGRLVSKSVVGVLQSTVPALSPPAWTSMFTGVNPGKHGIVDFLLHEGDEFVTCYSRFRMCDSIWRIVSSLGRKCIVINDPVTYPPEEVNGIMTTGMMTPPESDNWIYPRELRSEIDMVAGGYITDIPGDFVSLILNDRSRAAELIEDLTVKVFRVSKYAASKYEWDLLAAFFTASDRLQHYWWNDQSQLSKYYTMLDLMLAEYVKLADAANADLIIVSDHGFGPARRLFRLDKWLQESGFALYKKTAFSRTMSAIGLSRTNIIKLWPNWRTTFMTWPKFMREALRRVVPEGENVLDRRRSEAYGMSAGGGVFVNGDKIHDVAMKLREATDTTTGERVFEEVLYRDDVLKGPYSYRAPDILMRPRLGYYSFPWDMTEGMSVEKYQAVFTGVHRPEGIFVHYRPERPQIAGTPIPVSLRPWDVTALALSAMGVRVPEYFDGKVPSYASEGQEPARRPQLN